MMIEKPLATLISHRKNLERILDNMKEGIIAHDLNREVFFFNAEAERITGYKREEVLGRDCHVAFGAPLCGTRCSFCENKPDIKGSKSYTLNVISKSGEIKRIELTATAMEDEKGALIGVLASFKDITELLELKRKNCGGFSNIIGRDVKIQTIFDQIIHVAQYDYPVHIFGETGTGKELVAKAIHTESQRSAAPFVPINCGALPEGLIESELFGHVKGAFSGAIRDKKGRFEIADNGTVFLDEIADLSKPLQVKLLRFLQEGTFEKVGSENSIKVNVRIISATNKDLKQEVKKNNFRDDLFYRLKVIPIHIPPLRERKNDIPLLIRHFLNESAENGQPNGLKTVSDDALARLMDYTWPGNVRELQNAVQFAIVKSGHRVTITPEDLPLELRDMVCFPSRRGPLKKLDRRMVESVLTKTDGNKAKAAKLLGVGRATLYRFLNENPDILS